MCLIIYLDMFDFLPLAITTSRPTPTPTPTSLSECSSYKFLNESNRAMTYNQSSPLICDSSLSGWYRFGGEAGNQMPESCVEKRRCGTHAPGWLNGKHPSVADGVVQRKVCFHWSSGCCQWTTNITVRNCGGFFVYKLIRPPACTLRYCGNGVQSAPECSNYKSLTEFNRAQGYKGPSNAIACDRSLKKGWYRFQGNAGKQMPNRCVPKRHCGTHAPGWLNGSHPSIADGAVSRKVCFHWSSGCCQWSSNIRVRNCGGFYVYELPPTRFCSLRYCGDRGQAITTSRPTPTPTPTSLSECSSYKFLNESNRAMTYNQSSPLICDSSLSGWYRFGGEAGNQMPESCVDKRHCGTHAPGWLNGKHPSVADGVVQRKVCFHWSSSCCLWSTNIEVRNCGGFYVYKLSRPPACTLRYCGNGVLAPTTVPTPPPTVLPSPTRASHGFILLCLPAGMVVKIKRKSLPSEADPSLLHLNDPGCGALSVNDENIVMKTPLEGCGTVRRSIGAKASFHNNIIVPSGFGNKRSLLQFPFRCTYSKIGYPGLGMRSEPFYKRDEVMDSATDNGTL